MMFNPGCHKARLPRPYGLVLFICLGFIYNFTQASAAVPVQPQSSAGFDKKILLKSEVTEDLPEEKVSFGFSNEATFLPKYGVNAMEGGVSLAENDAEVSYEYKIMGKIPWEIYFDSGYTGIDNSTEVNLTAKLTSIGLGFNITLPFFFDQAYLRFSMDPSFNSDDWVIKGSTFRSPFDAIFIYQPDKKLTIGAGVAVSPRYKFRNLVAPLFGFIYKPDETWTFNILSQRPQVICQFNKNLALLLEAGFTDEEYVVKKDNIKEVVIRNFDNRYGFGARYKINKNIEASALAGWVVDRTLKYRDDLGKVAIKPGMYSQFRIDMSI